jgi:hypothetical protein
MRVYLAAVDVAQCQTCGGTLVAAGDDWRHQESTGCTDLGTPVICWHGDCGMPAAVGSEACTEHAGALLCPEGVGLRS